MATWRETAGEYLAYETPKMVRVKDPCLGLTRYILLFAVIAYAIYEFVDKREYLDLSVPIGTAEVFIKPHEMSENAKESLKQKICPASGQNECLDWGPEKARFPQGDVNSVSITTHFKIRDTPTDYYLIGVENMYFKISHNMQDVKHFSGKKSKDKFSQSDLTMNGKLVGKEGTNFTEIRWKGNQGKSDADDSEKEECLVKVKTLLEAAGLNDKDIEENRKEGAVFLITIKYFNTAEMRGKRWPEYVISVSQIKGASSLIAQTIYKEHPVSGTDPIVLERNGFRFIFQTGGEIGQFNWIVFLNNLVIKIVVLSVVHILLENFLAYCCFTRKDWDDLKHDVADFQVIEQFRTGGKVDRERLHARVVELKSAEDGKIVGVIKDAKVRRSSELIEIAELEQTGPKTFDL